MNIQITFSSTLNFEIFIHKINTHVTHFSQKKYRIKSIEIDTSNKILFYILQRLIPEMFFIHLP